MGKVTKFTVEKIPRFPTMAPAAKINLKDKVEDGEIDLSMSDLQDVPVKEIASIKKAHSLDLSNNRLTTLPKTFTSLTHLIKLDLSKNQLKELPENFGDLNKLKHLDLYKNELQHLPLSFSKLKALKWLDLKDNPLVPGVAKVAGLCLDAKQCHTCAKDVINFYSQLQEKVDQERETREAQRQKDLLANEKAKQQQVKKPKKDKKEKVKQKDNNEVIKESTKLDDVPSQEPILTNSKQVPTKPSFIKIIVITLLASSITLFLLTAAKVKNVEVIEHSVRSFWSSSLSKLPPSLHDVGSQIGTHFNNIHEKTGLALEAATDYVIELHENDRVNNLIGNFYNYVNVSVVKLTEFYKEVFGSITAK